MRLYKKATELRNQMKNVLIIKTRKNKQTTHGVTFWGFRSFSLYAFKPRKCHLKQTKLTKVIEACLLNSLTNQEYMPVGIINT